MLLRVVRRQVSTFNNIDSVQKSREEFRPRQFYSMYSTRGRTVNDQYCRVIIQKADGKRHGGVRTTIVRQMQCACVSACYKNSNMRTILKFPEIHILGLVGN